MIELKVNGKAHQVDTDPSTPLLYVLRDELALNGAKFGCGLGQCGACTVMIDGRAVLSCVTPVSVVASRPVVTVEGLGTADKPGPLQKAFEQEQAAQCGYCIAGMIMRAQALLERNRRPTDNEIRQAMATNLCRCGTHMRILRAVRRAADTMNGTASVPGSVPASGTANVTSKGQRHMNATPDLQGPAMRGVQAREADAKADVPAVAQAVPQVRADSPAHDPAWRPRPTRRGFLAAGGALVVAFASWPTPSPAADAEAGLPGSLKTAPQLDGWIRIDAQGAITVFTGKAELGQGIQTALIQVAAEELRVAPSRIKLITADTGLTPNEGYTAGSHSMQDSGTAIRHAAAQVRAILLARAAERLSLPSDGLLLGNNGVTAGNGASAASVAYADLVDDPALHAAALPQGSAQDTLREASAHAVVGQSMPRVDIPAKLSGGAAYVQDLRLDGMVHARVVRPPSRGASLRALDDGAVAGSIGRMPGVLKVVRDGRFMAVITQREYQAVQASRALGKLAQWDEAPSLPAGSKLYPSVLDTPSQDTVILDRGAVEATATGGKTISATYRRPFMAHASIGPSCAVAQLVDGKYTVWTHTQGVFPLRKALAEMLRVPPDTVRCIHTQGSGCYGHNGADDVAADAALLARAMPGKPVRVQWMREEEFGCEPLSPPMISDAKATLDATGRIVNWSYEVRSATHNSRPGAAGDLLAATHLAEPFVPSVPKPIPQPEGGGDRNAIPLYVLPNVKVTHHFLPTSPLRVSALRSLGAYVNVYSIESFIDELALAAGADPVEFRQRHLEDPRALEVIRVAAERFGWKSYKRQAGRGRGFAFARYKNLAAYAAIATEVEVRRDTGEVRILRVVAAVDSGEAVNPDGIRNQMEGGIVQSASWTLQEAMGFDETRITSLDWGGYPILRFPQVPLQVDVHIVDRPGQPFLGTGEAAQGPTAGAIANALADASGVRLRDLPFDRKRVRAALGLTQTT